MAVCTRLSHQPKNGLVSNASLLQKLDVLTINSQNRKKRRSQFQLPKSGSENFQRFNLPAVHCTLKLQTCVEGLEKEFQRPSVSLSASLEHLHLRSSMLRAQG
ncbi:hypothetical protein JTE90_012808 [Oedothorax gibbosus]|uniref:Uncharacterized protein n=1 Tax=Oedothorax gibbosus TaxID=931172 RepID=A0AAV6W0B1_9ARAC|nr:hypothetical protein JTE90_012808 [Oedothorax gibbosus]